VLHDVAVCSVLCVVVCRRVLQGVAERRRSVADGYEATTQHVCCSVLQRAVSVLQCVAVCCSVLQTHGALLQMGMKPQHGTSVAARHSEQWVCCSVLQCVAVCCSVLQCVAVCCSVLQCVAERQRSVADGRCKQHGILVTVCCSVQCAANCRETARCCR